MASFVETTAPATLPISVDDIILQCRLSNVDASQEAYLERLAATAIDHAQTTMDCSLMARTLTATFYEGEKIWRNCLASSRA